MTRAQRERHSGQDLQGYPRLSEDSLRGKMFRDTRLMHPLPRLDEIDYDLDDDPRSVYFRQAELGVPIRMALMASLLGKIELSAAPIVKLAQERHVSSMGGFVCKNDQCITNGEGQRYLSHEFIVFRDQKLLLSCVYCAKVTRPRFIGHRETKLYATTDSPWARDLNAPVELFFATAEQARVAGFRPHETV